MQRLADMMLEYWDVPMFAAFRGFLMGALVVCVIWVIHELHVLRKMSKSKEDEDEEAEK